MLVVFDSRDFGQLWSLPELGVWQDGFAIANSNMLSDLSSPQLMFGRSRTDRRLVLLMQTLYTIPNLIRGFAALRETQRMTLKGTLFLNVITLRFNVPNCYMERSLLEIIQHEFHASLDHSKPPCFVFSPRCSIILIKKKLIKKNHVSELSIDTLVVWGKGEARPPQTCRVRCWSPWGGTYWD